MKVIQSHIFAIIALVSCTLVRGQGTFQNLDFEEANIVPIPGQPFAITVANALPDWTVEYGNAQQTQIYYNAASLGGTQVTLIADGYPSSSVSSFVIDGNFSVFLQGGLFDGSPANASISQIGQIPAGTQTLLFDVGNLGENLLPNVFIGNDELTLFPIRTGTGVSIGYTTYGANISAWSGQTEQLTFSTPGENVLLDDISFSPGTVPEPNSLSLTGIGAVLFGIYRRFAAKRQ